MTIRPKLSRTSEALAERKRRSDDRQHELRLEPQELYREACEDEDGNPYTVIVWRPFPGLNLTDYTLDDGRGVKYVDEHDFEIIDSGIIITRA